MTVREIFNLAIKGGMVVLFGLLPLWVLALSFSDKINYFFALEMLKHYSSSQEKSLKMNPSVKRTIYLQGMATTDDILESKMLGYQGKVLNLTFTTSMYQWQEKTTAMVRSRTIYTYEKRWLSTYVDSTMFNRASKEHTNPPDIGVGIVQIYPKKIMLAGLQLMPEFYPQLSGAHSVDYASLNTKNLSKVYSKPVFINNDALYLGEDPDDPQIGDIRIQLMVVPPQVFSVFGIQEGTTLHVYKSKNQEVIPLLQVGKVPIEKLFAMSLGQKIQPDWLYIGLLFVVIYIGSMALIDILNVLPFNVPLLTSLLDAACNISEKLEIIACTGFVIITTCFVTLCVSVVYNLAMFFNGTFH